METSQVRILLVDDHTLFREGVVRLLSAEADFDVVDHCSTVDEAIEALAKSSVDIVLLDIDLGAERGSGLLVRSRQQGYRGRFLVVTAGVSQQEGSYLLQLGVDGVFLKHSPPEELANGIRAVMKGEKWIDEKYAPGPGRTTGRSDAIPARNPLTSREREVLKRVFEGLANKEIAGQLHVSESSVKATLQQLFDKTGVRTRSQLVRAALEHYLDQL